MPATLSRLGALLGLGLIASPAFGQYFVTSAYHQPIPCAPNACGGGFYTVCPDGTAFGPNYYLRPPWPPFQAPPPGQMGGGAGQNNGRPVLLYHPYVRGPRDFFMWGDMMEEQILRERRPALVP